MSTIYNTQLRIILLFSLYQVLMARSIELRTGRSSFNPKHFSNFTLNIANNSLYLDMTIIKPLVPGFKTNLDFQIRLHNSKVYQSLFNYNLDVCNIVISFKDSLFKKWFKNAIKYGNFMDNCPVNKGHYYLNGWHLDSNLVPNYLYPGDYRVKGHGYYGKFKSKGEDFVVECEVDGTII